MYRELIEGAIEHQARCLDKPEEYVDYRDDETPTVAEAEAMCYGCPMRTLCGKYADKAKESYGVWAGKVRTYED